MTQLSCPFFDFLTPSQLTRLLAKHTQAKVVWLNNADKTVAGKDAENDQSSVGVIGIFPKVSWTAYPTNNNLTNNPKDCFIIHKTENDKTEHHKTETSHKSYQEWTDALVTYCKKQTKNSHNKSLKIDGYHNGLMGFIGYDMAAHALSNEVSIKPNQPCAHLGHYDVYLTCTVTKQPQQNQYTWQLNASSKNVSDKLQQIFDWLKNITTSAENSPTNPLPLNPVWQFTDYEQAFNKTQAYLHAGDCYQINLTQAWVGKLSSDDAKDANNGKLLVDYLPKLHANTNAPFAGYLQTNNVQQNNFELVSCSPELFFTFKKEHNNHVIITKPIKGTRPRGKNEQTDQQLKHELANSEKDLAENVMIVDLLRNDLGKFAEVGTVKVPRRFEIESYSNVHHMVSTISATLKADTHPLAVLFGSLPAGSVTGTPKKRVVEIIHELEAKTSKNEDANHLERGAYCGTMGYLNFDGTGQWNVLIRTLQCNDNTVSLWAGGGITVASDCKAEYQECWDKVGNLIEVLNQ